LLLPRIHLRGTMSLKGHGLAAAEEVRKIEAVAEVRRHDPWIEVVLGDSAAGIGELGILPDLLGVETERPALTQVDVRTGLQHEAPAVAEIDTTADVRRRVEIVDVLDTGTDIRLEAPIPSKWYCAVSMGGKTHVEASLPTTPEFPCTFSWAKQQKSSTDQFLVR